MEKVIRITDRDRKLLEFLAEYKVMSLDNAKYVYGTVTYQEKRIVALVKHGYVKRLKHRYIVLGTKGREYLDDIGIEVRQHCRNVNNIERLNIISDIAAFLSFNYRTCFYPSWQLKSADEPTDHSRRYIGECTFERKFYMVYAIYEGKSKRYITSIYYDIKREQTNHHNMIFTNDIETLIYKKKTYNPHFKNILIILYNDFSKSVIRNYEKIKYCVLLHLKRKHTTEWIDDEDDIKHFDYLVDEHLYMKFMPFIDMDELGYLGRYFEPSWKHTKDVIIICLEENLELLQKLYPYHKFFAIARDQIEEFIKQEYFDGFKWRDKPGHYD